MTAFVTLGYNFASNPLPPAAKEEHKTTAPAQGPKEHTHNSIRKPKCLFLAAKILLGLLVAGLCVTAVIFLTDFFEEKMGHGGFLPHTPCRADGAGAGHGFGVFDSARNGQHGTIQPGEWCKQHPGDCHWVDSQVCGSSLPGFASGEVVADWPACFQG
ncbi:hypothetical protein CSUB01_04917 [Colletotrichum sublineola]|uniref:Uncharacterized protein n=1 Tax=Colletotrichum sublineola TaxID=1173701 RepID=A0A066XUH4_COLSU|nr:hypothetical protein CSUB01_04917 [Colletotrichum sublineola]